MSRPNLDAFLKKPENSVLREKIVNYKFFHEVKLAAAKAQNDIRIFIPEIDKDGYDVILDDGDIVKPFQLKAINGSSTTSEWEIRKKMLRPLPLNAGRLGFEFSPEGTGTEGGFILVSVNIENEDVKDLSYYYTDAYLVKAFEIGLIRFNNKSYEEKIRSFVSSLHRGLGNEKIIVNKSKLIKVKSVEHLLALADLQSIHYNQWQLVFCNYLDNYFANKIIEGQREEVVDLLKAFIDDSRIKIG
jgi:hypothetical protein